MDNRINFENFKKYYQTKIEKPVLENPHIALVSSFAIKFFASIIAGLCTSLGVSIFLMSFLIDFALVKNIDKVIDRGSNKIQRFYENTFLSPEERGRRQGLRVRNKVEQIAIQAGGFLDGLIG
ncbi:MAG: hypothetical protein JXA94_05190 [Parachlamydiales bacterium]|nr:hypothetical protein [Parachlamydiales bacterium]